MKQVHLEKTVDIDTPGMHTCTVTYEVTADMSYTPARISGPPEQCCPADADCDIFERKILSVTDEDGVTFVPDAAQEQRLLAALDWDTVEEALWEKYGEQED